MKKKVKKKITIGGIGSVLLGDDGIGPCVAGMLEASYRFDDNVTVVDLGTPGLDLVAHLSGIDALILVDAVANGAQPGTVTLYRKEEILRHGPSPVRMDPHSPALSESLMIADFSGQGPREVLLIGVTGEQYEALTSLSEAALRGIQAAVEEVLQELDRMGVAYSKQNDKVFSVWWNPDTIAMQIASRAAEADTVAASV